VANVVINQGWSTVLSFPDILVSVILTTHLACCAVNTDLLFIFCVKSRVYRVIISVCSKSIDVCNNKISSIASYVLLDQVIHRVTTK
jgi:hypothetical protein